MNRFEPIKEYIQRACQMCTPPIIIKKNIRLQIRDYTGQSQVYEREKKI